MIPLRDVVPRRTNPFVIWTLIALNSLVFFFELSLSGDSLQRFTALFGLIPIRYTQPELLIRSPLQVTNYWPFITHMFIHGGWLHLIGNMWFLWIFGDNVEDRMGHLRFVVFYLACGLAAALSNIVINPGATMPMIGASGAISGVMGSYLLLFPAARVITLIPIFFWPLIVEIPAFFFVGLWFCMQVLSGTYSLLAPQIGGGIAWWAHIGGFVAGMVLMPLFKKRTGIYRRPHFPDEQHYRALFR